MHISIINISHEPAQFNSSTLTVPLKTATVLESKTPSDGHA
jgi:hypothetical protein